MSNGSNRLTASIAEIISVLIALLFSSWVIMIMLDALNRTYSWVPALSFGDAFRATILISVVGRVLMLDYTSRYK